MSTIDERAEELLHDRARLWHAPATVGFRDLTYDLTMVVRHMNAKDAHKYLIEQLQTILSNEVEACAGHIKGVREGWL